MDEIQNQPLNTNSGEKNGQPARRLRLPDLPDYKLGAEGDLNGFDSTDSEFLHFVQTLVPLTGENLDHWTWEERRDFLNWCLDEGILTIQDGRLVHVEELGSSAPLTHETSTDAPKSEDDAGFLRDVDRAKPVIHAHQQISAKELADALGLKSAVYAQTLKVYVNAQHAQEEEAT
jgi:hypothetical protein